MPKRLLLTVLPQNILVPSHKSLAFFLQENPPLLLKDLQVLWQVLCYVVGMVMVEDGVGVLFPGLLVLFLRRRLLDSRLICEMWMLRSLVVLRLRRRLFLAVRSVYLVQAPPVSSGKVFGPVSGYVESDSGIMQFCGAVTAPCGAETDFSDTQFCGAFVAPVPSGAETEPNGGQVHGAAASSGAIETDLENAQSDGAVASPLGFETELKDAQFCEAEAKSGFKTPRSRGLMVASSGPLRCVAGHLGRRRKGRAAVGAG